MKKGLILLAVLMLSSAGCITGRTSGGAEGAKATKTTATSLRPPTVYVESITTENAHDRALALEAEMDFDMQSTAAPLPPAATR
jgi:hypothetical protein